MTQETLALHADVLTGKTSPRQSEKEEEIEPIFSHWSTTVQKLTNVKRTEHIKPVYKDLVENLNQIVYDKKLLPDPLLLPE